MRKDFKVMGHWFEKFKRRCSEEQLKDLCYLTIKYGLLEEKDIDIDNIEDDLVATTFEFIVDQIENMQSDYDKKVAYGKAVGRNSTYNEEENRQIYELATQGLSARKIAEKMGINDEKKIKAIYNADGWKKAKQEK